MAKMRWLIPRLSETISGENPKREKMNEHTHSHTNCVRAFIYNLVRACFQHHGEQQHLPQHREINTKNKQWNILFLIHRIWKVNILTWIYWHSQRCPRKKTDYISSVMCENWSNDWFQRWSIRSVRHNNCHHWVFFPPDTQCKILYFSWINIFI